MKNMSLNEQIQNIIKSDKSYTSKRSDLLKIGLRPCDAELVLYSNGVERTPFNATRLSFGVEIECFGPSRSEIMNAFNSRSVAIESQSYNHDDSRTYFKIVSDGSINATHGTGNEVVSPILSGRNGLATLKAACDALNEAQACVNKSTGLHVHMDAHNLSFEHYKSIFVNYARLELAIDSFMARSRRASNNTYCDSLRGRLARIEEADSVQGISRACSNDRYFKVNPTSITRHGTVEFRQHQGTVEFEKISMWLKFLQKMVTWSLKNRLDHDITSIDEIPFLNATEKAFFTRRASVLR